MALNGRAKSTDLSSLDGGGEKHATMVQKYGKETVQEGEIPSPVLAKRGGWTMAC